MYANQTDVNELSNISDEIDRLIYQVYLVNKAKARKRKTKKIIKHLNESSNY
jgi:hypothetical protein